MRKVLAALAVITALAVPTMVVADPPLITGAQIQDDSLTGADVLESSLAQVPSAMRADGLTVGYRIYEPQQVIDPGQAIVGEAHCPTGYEATAGIWIAGDGVEIHQSFPPTIAGSDHGRWLIRATNEASTPQHFQVGAVCLQLGSFPQVIR